MKADENTSEADLAELEKALEDYESELDEGIADGTLVEVDGLMEIVKINDALNEELIEKYGEEALAELAEKLCDEVNAKIEEIYEKADALTGSVAENREAIEEIKAELEAIMADIEKCLNGTHLYEYEVTSPASCGVNAKEKGACAFCGETDEREVEGSALNHSFSKYEEVTAPECGKVGLEFAYCDNNCGETDEKEIEALEHIFLDYISNGDATCTADGTKTAECVNGCGATDTVTDEDTMLDHPDEDGDKLCDECQAEIVDICPDCGGKVHEETGVPQYICMLITLVKLVASLFKALGIIA